MKTYIYAFFVGVFGIYPITGCQPSTPTELGRKVPLSQAQEKLWKSIMLNHIYPNWRMPSGLPEGLECTFFVTLAKGDSGDIANVDFRGCNHPLTSFEISSMYSAILMSSPLPMPPGPNSPIQQLTVVFEPKEVPDVVSKGPERL